MDEKEKTTEQDAQDTENEVVIGNLHLIVCGHYDKTSNRTLRDILMQRILRDVDDEVKKRNAASKNDEEKIEPPKGGMTFGM